MRAMWIRGALIIAACLGALAAPAAEQQPAPQPVVSTGMLAGRVVDATSGQPISNVAVGLIGGSGPPPGRGSAPRQVLTDSQGRFVFVNLPPGRFLLLMQRFGYAASPMALSRVVELAAEQKITDLAIRMHRLASIAGAVTDENGDPVVGMGVVAFRRAVLNGQTMSLPVGESRTDDRGAYHVVSLPAGDYAVCACRRDAIPVDGVLLTTLASDPVQLLGAASRALKVGADAASLESLRTFAPTFYPSSQLMSRATRVTLADAEDRSGIDIQVPVVRAARISGRVIGAPNGVTANSVRLRLAGDLPESSPAIEPMLVQPDGRFDFAGVPPGSYVISVSTSSILTAVGPTGASLAFLGGRGGAGSGMAPPPPPPPGSQQSETWFWGQTPVVVGDADVTGVTVVLKKAAQVKPKFELPPGAPPPTRQQPAVRGIQLLPLAFDTRGVPSFSRMEPDGSVVLPNVAPGRYALGFLTSFEVSKVMLGATDVTDLPIDVGEDDVNDLVVTLANPSRAVIAGTVTGNFMDTSVLVFPADPRLWADPAASRRWFFAAPVDRAGKFTTGPSIVAGDYLVLVVPDEQTAEWQQQARLESLAPRAQKVTVASGETKTIEVKR